MLFSMVNKWQTSRSRREPWRSFEFHASFLTVGETGPRKGGPAAGDWPALTRTLFSERSLLLHSAGVEALVICHLFTKPPSLPVSYSQGGPQAHLGP